MRFGIIGLGRMGGNLARHAIGRGHQVVGYDRDAVRTRESAQFGLVPAFSLDELLAKLEPPRAIFVYVPHGQPTDEAIGALKGLRMGDLVADGGNSHWVDSQRHHEILKEVGVAFLDVGTSGGIEGAREGACFMVGGEQDAFARIEPLLQDLATPDGVTFAGPLGSGHFVKLVHNAIEFGMVQAIAEGVDLLTRWQPSLDLPALFHNWNHGSVIRSWLVELMEQSLREHDLGALSAYVEDTREVKWVVEYALNKESWIPVIAQSELAFYRYRDPESTAGKAVALLRHAYGGHPLYKRLEAGQAT
jgi:6-phosphogluconate dehydrogenase